MPVNDSLLITIHILFSGLAEKHKEKHGEYLAKNRKKLKILVETVTEQLVESYFHKKPNNIPTAKLIINSNKKEITDTDDAALLNALSNVLIHYEVLSDKTYIDHKPELESLVQKEMRILFLNLVLHKKLAMNTHAKRLRILLHGLQ
jgi:hypothetical protein